MMKHDDVVGYLAMADRVELGVFHFDEGRESFEDLGADNGGKKWSARALMDWLGYGSWPPFFNAINRAIGTCTTLGIPVAENFEQIPGDDGADFKLSRFACCLIALNGDVKKPRVAAAQAYFVSLAEVVRLYLHDAESVDRVMIRDEISEHEITLRDCHRTSDSIYRYLRQDLVVPFSMEGIAFNVECGDLFIGDLEAGRVEV